MQGQSVGARLRGAMAHSGPRKAAEGGRPVLGMVESPASALGHSPARPISIAA